MTSRDPSVKRVWIDTDTAIGVEGADVDDGLALVQAFHSPELEVVGVSSVFGNAPIEKTHPLATELCERFGPKQVRVARGAASASELGKENAALRALVGALEDAKLWIAAIGPLTNIGSLLTLRPDLTARIEGIVMVAARRPGQRFLSHPEQPAGFPDLNFECDPAAMQVLLDSTVPLVFAPWELSSHVWLTTEDLDRIAIASESGAYIAQASHPWLEIWQRDLKAPGFNPFDTLAIGWLTHPQWFQYFEAPVWIEEGPADRPPVENHGAATRSDPTRKPYLLVDPDAPRATASRRAIYCHRPARAFKPMLLERLTRKGDAQ